MRRAVSNVIPDAGLTTEISHHSWFMFTDRAGKTDQWLRANAILAENWLQFPALL